MVRHLLEGGKFVCRCPITNPCPTWWMREGSNVVCLWREREYVRWVRWDDAAVGEYSRGGVHHAPGCFTLLELDAMANKLLAVGRGKQPVNGKAAKLVDSDFVKKFPAVHAFMTEVEDEKGKERSVSKVTVFVEAGQIKASLSDPDSECSTYVSCDTLAGVWEALETRLSAGEAEWRAWAGGKPQKGRKRS
jgi:hypothetical protein